MKEACLDSLPEISIQESLKWVQRERKILFLINTRHVSVSFVFYSIAKDQLFFFTKTLQLWSLETL